jgi:hypothetical protein
MIYFQLRAARQVMHDVEHSCGSKEGGIAMAGLRSAVVLVVATAMLATGLTLAVPAPMAGGFGDGGPDSDQVIREGQVVAITDSTITIREWAGLYTYRLTPTGRHTLQTSGIRPGDKVQFHAYSVWEIAYYFRKISSGPPAGS